MIEKHHGSQSDLNLALLNFVNQRGRASYAELFACFADDSLSDREAHKSFGKKLEYLCLTEQLQHINSRGQHRHFSIGPLADGKHRPSAALAGATGPARAPAPAPARAHLQYAGPVVPPRAVNWLHGPVYAPSASVCLRPGSEDFKRCPSVGHAC